MYLCDLHARVCTCVVLCSLVMTSSISFKRVCVLIAVLNFICTCLCVRGVVCIRYGFFNLVQAYIFINVPMCGMTICDAFCFYLTHITIFYNLKALYTYKL